MDNTTRKIMWNYAGTAGLLLGLTSTITMYIGQLMATMTLNSIATSVAGILLWMLETCTCIYLMWIFMKKFAAACPSVSNSDTFKMGMATAFLSALVYSTATFANIAYISADYYAEMFQSLSQQLSAILDSNSKATLEKIFDNIAQLTFFSNLIHCTIFGTVVSAIISRYIPSKDPFADYKPDEQ